MRRIGFSPCNFNPLSLYRERPNHIIPKGEYDAFQSTLPIQGETFLRRVRRPPVVFQSTLPIQGETDLEAIFLAHAIFQSTLPIQGETKTLIRFCRASSISIHSPYTGRDPGGAPASPSQPIFQSTLPIQGETNIFLNIIQIP